MIRWLSQPSSTHVASFVKNYWFIEKDPNSDSTPFPKLNPDPSAHLIISPANQNYSYQAGDSIFKGYGSHLLYPSRSTFELDHRQPFMHIGIKFHVGALYSIKQLGDPQTCLDQVTTIDLVNLLSCLESDIAQLLFSAQSNPETCCKTLDNLLSLWLEGTKRDHHAELVAKALEKLDKHPIAELGHTMHCSQRTLERSFRKVTGLTLKQCQSMNRLEAMLEHIYSLKKEDIIWPDIAVKFGFSDQSHLIRYLKMHLGLTPNDYATTRGLTIDAYGGISDFTQ